MRVPILAAVLSVILLRPGLAQADASASSVTLRQCYEWTLAQSEDLKLRREDIEQSRQRARAAIGGVFPKLDWGFTDTWQDPHGVNILNAQGFSGFIAKEQPQSQFSLKQPLFSGFKEFSALEGFHREGARDSLFLDRASRGLYETVVTAYYAVLGQETERDNTRAALGLAQDRVKELKDYLRLGKARESEVFTAQAHASALKADLLRSAARIAVAREDLSFLTGQDLAGRPLQDELSVRPAMGPLEDAVGRVHERADVKAQREEIAASEMRVRYEQGSFWPSLDLLGNYYTQRATFLSAVKWDVALSLQVPLFHGGSTLANVRRASSALRQAVSRLEQLERRVVHDIRRVYGELSSAVEEAKSQEEAALAAQKSYDSLLEEYRLGLVTNLDVIQALDFLQSQKNTLAAARLRAKVLFIQLGVATETLP